MNWQDAANWSGDATPGAGDDVTINAANANLTVSFSGGTTEIRSLTCKDSLAISGGTLQINQASSIQALQLSGGTLTGAGDVTVWGSFAWSNGTLSGSGTLDADGGITLDGGILDGRTLNNNGLVTMTGGVSIADGAVINNETGALWDIQADVGVNGVGTFNNSGTLRKSVGAGEWPAPASTFNLTFNNSGTVDLRAGRFELGSGTSSGRFTAAAGTQLAFVGAHTFTVDSSIQGYQVSFWYSGSSRSEMCGSYSASFGTDLQRGSVDFLGSVGSVGNLYVFDGAANFSPTVATTLTLTALELYGPQLLQTTGSPGALTGTDSFIVSGAFLWNGVLSGSGTLDASGGITLDGGTLDGRTLNNNGMAVWTSGTVVVTNGGSVTNTLTGTFDDQIDGTIGDSSSCPAFINQGLFLKSGGNGTAYLNMDLYNSGTVEVQSGNLNVSCGYIQTSGSTVAAGGTFSGPVDIQGGTVQGNVSVDYSVTGQVNSGPSTTPTVPANSFTQTSTGVLNELIGGATAGTQYGQIAVTGVVNLAGSLNVSFINGFSPTLNEVFTIIRNDGTAPVNGTFTNLPEGSLVSAGGWQFKISYQGGDGNDVTLTAVTQSTTTALTPSALTSTYGNQITLTANVVPQSGGIPTGTVTFYEVTSTGTTISQIGAATVNAVGVANLAYSSFTAGTHYVAAIFTSNSMAYTNSSLSNLSQLTVDRRSITPVITAYSKVYDGNSSATLYNESLAGVLPADLGNVTLTVQSATFADPNAGTNKTVTATGLTLSGSAASDYVLSSTTATTTANITAKMLSATGSTQNSINISKNGTITFSITNVSGEVNGDTRTTYQLFNGSKFTMQVGSNTYSIVSSASVDQATGTIYITWNMTTALYNDLVAVLGPNTSPSNKQLTNLILNGYSSDGNYEITTDCMANIFSSGKIVWS